MNFYIVFQYGLVLLFTAAFLLKLNVLNDTQRYLGALIILVSVMIIGVLLEGKRWGKFAEFTRLLILPILLFVFTSIGVNLILLSILILITLVSLLWLRTS